MTDLSTAANGAASRPLGEAPIADITARPHINTGTLTDAAVADSLAKALAEARTMFDAKSKVLIDKAQATFADLKVEAAKRRDEGVELVRDKPYAAIGVAVLAGFLLGHLLSASRPQVVYLRDRR